MNDQELRDEMWFEARDLSGCTKHKQQASRCSRYDSDTRPENTLDGTDVIALELKDLDVCGRSDFQGSGLCYGK